MRDPYHGTDGGLGRTSNNRHAQGTTSDRRFYSSTGFWSGMPASSSCMEPRHHQSLSATRLEPQAENAAGGPGTGLPFHLDTTVIEVRRPMRDVIPQDAYARARAERDDAESCAALRRRPEHPNRRWLAPLRTHCQIEPVKFRREERRTRTSMRCYVGDPCSALEHIDEALAATDIYAVAPCINEHVIRVAAGRGDTTNRAIHRIGRKTRWIAKHHQKPTVWVERHGEVRGSYRWRWFERACQHRDRLALSVVRSAG
jgi:hypothetical protein